MLTSANPNISFMMQKQSAALNPDARPFGGNIVFLTVSAESGPPTSSVPLQALPFLMQQSAPAWLRAGKLVEVATSSQISMGFELVMAEQVRV